MLLDTNRPAPAQCGHGTAPDHRREELLNRLCTLREDPRFAEWCHLTAALGLGDLPIEGLAALGIDSADGLFPELRALPDGDGDRAAERIFGAGVAPGIPLAWPTDRELRVGAEPPVPFAALNDMAFDGRIVHLHVDSGRVG